MSQPSHPELNPAQTDETPLQQVHEQQSLQEHNRAAREQQVDSTPEVPGGGSPSDRRHHPQRQMYGSGSDES